MAPRRRPTGSGTAYEHLDPATKFLYVPHTVTFLLLGKWMGTAGHSRQALHPWLQTLREQASK